MREGLLMLRFQPETTESMVSTLAVARGLRPTHELAALLRKKKLSSWRSMSMKSRFVTLTERGLVYYKKKGDKTPKGYIDITPTTDVEVTNRNRYAVCGNGGAGGVAEHARHTHARWLSFIVRTAAATHEFVCPTPGVALIWAQVRGSRFVSVFFSLFWVWCGVVWWLLLAPTAGGGVVGMVLWVCTLAQAIIVHTIFLGSVKDMTHTLRFFSPEDRAKFCDLLSLDTSTTPVASEDDRQWFYIDDFDQPQGPFKQEILYTWVQAGYFREHTLVKPAPLRDENPAAYPIFLPISTLFPKAASSFRRAQPWKSKYSSALMYQVRVALAWWYD